MPAQEHGRAVLLRGFNVFTVKSARRNGRVADVVEQKVQQNPRKMQSNPQNKDPSGGTTGRVKPYGRLGWMGARAEYSRWEGIPAPTCHWSPGARRTFKTAGRFFNFLGTSFGTRIYRAAGRLASMTADLSDAIAAPGGLKSGVPGISF